MHAQKELKAMKGITAVACTSSMPKSTTFSSTALTSLTLNLVSKVIEEMVDMGFTSSLSITM